jgi:hypothetical protein
MYESLPLKLFWSAKDNHAADIMTQFGTDWKAEYFTPKGTTDVEKIKSAD